MMPGRKEGRKEGKEGIFNESIQDEPDI